MRRWERFTGCWGLVMSKLWNTCLYPLDLINGEPMPVREQGGETPQAVARAIWQDLDPGVGPQLLVVWRDGEMCRVFDLLPPSPEWEVREV